MPPANVDAIDDSEYDEVEQSELSKDLARHENRAAIFNEACFCHPPYTCGEDEVHTEENPYAYRDTEKLPVHPPPLAILPA